MEFMMKSREIAKRHVLSHFLLSVLIFGLASIVEGKEGDFRGSLELVHEDSLIVNPLDMIDKCTNALVTKSQISPRELEALHERRGDAYFRLGNLEKAKNDFDQLVNLRPKDPIALCKQASSLRNPEESLKQLKSIIKDLQTHLPGAHAFLPGPRRSPGDAGAIPQRFFGERDRHAEAAGEWLVPKSRCPAELRSRM
jgi:hypothetical protein